VSEASERHGGLVAEPTSVEEAPPRDPTLLLLFICDVAIGTLVAAPHALDLIGVPIYSPGAHGAEMWAPVDRIGKSIVRFWDAVYILLAIGIVGRRWHARAAFVTLSIVGLIFLANGLPGGELDFPGSTLTLVLAIAPLVLLAVSPRSRRYGWERRSSQEFQAYERALAAEAEERAEGGGEDATGFD
jgi:peptidoglycan/LPS O-acetylase OafA/YrhL